MRLLTQRDRVCIFVLCALMLMHSTEGEQSRTEREYVIQNRSLSWDEARNHCKVCFKDLVTLTPDNIQIIAQKLTSDSWIGLRKNFYHTSNSSSNYSETYNRNYTSNSSMPWTRWSNGDPLSFQNWYPGWPVLKSSSKKPTCYSCSCSCSCTYPSLMSPRPTSFTTRHSEFTTQSSFTSVPDLNMTNITSFTSVPDLNMTNITSFTSVPDLNMTNITSFTSVPDLNMTNITSFTSVPDLNMTNITSFTSVPDLNMTNITSFTSVPDINITSSTRVTSATDQNVLDFTTMAPPLPVEGECVCSPMLLHTDLEPDENYIEDSCVAMLSFGAWVEKHCSELLHFICYEDHFFGYVNVTNVTSSGVSLSWLPAPDGISHYRVEVRGDKQIETKNLTTDLFNLTAGTLYFVQVIPVKCDRDLKPQEVSFYTIPNKVTNLTVTNVTETSVSLMWNKPAGNLDFYLIEVDNKPNQSSIKEETEFEGLMPGSLYIFTVRTGVKPDNTFSEGSSISTYTKPGKVANLRVSENTNISLLLSWRPPEGHATSFWVQAMNDSNGKLFDEVMNRNSTQTQQQVKVTGLPTGTRITLSVTVLVNGTLKGDKETIVNFTAPGPISNLSLQTTHESLCATWTPPPGHYSFFTIILQQNGSNDLIRNGNVFMEEFIDLKAATKYTVIVYSVSGHLRSPEVKSSKFTLPYPPTDAQVVSSNKSQITIKWKEPSKTLNPEYIVHLNSSFWGHSWSSERIKQTTYTFNNLTSGTNYTFQVQTVTDEAKSSPLTISRFTESEEMEIGLSMMCLSTELLHCANLDSEESVFQQLQAHFNQTLGNAISWKLKKQEHENTPS